MDRPLEIRSAQDVNEESNELSGHNAILGLASHQPVKSAQHASGTETSPFNRSKKQTLIKKKTKVSKGHFFKNTVARDNARVQYGDTYNYGTCTRECSELEKRQKRQSPVKFAEAQVQVTIVAVLLLKILENFFQYVLRTIPKPIVSRVSVLEDAFGRTWRIDIDTISTWPEFESLLVHKFEKTRGLQRVKKGKYRLQGSSDKQLINPRHLPNFAMVFKPGTKVRMSIYFSWHEVQHTGCPRCMSEQSSLPGIEIICSTCAFSYTAESQETLEETPVDRVNQSSEINERSQYPRLPALSTIEYRPSAEDLDQPENFNRVSIGAATPALPRRQEKRLSERTNNRGHQCPQCGKVISRLGDLSRHIEDIHGPTFYWRCLTCGHWEHGPREDKMKGHCHTAHDQRPPNAHYDWVHVSQDCQPDLKLSVNNNARRRGRKYLSRP